MRHAEWFPMVTYPIMMPPRGNDAPQAGLEISSTVRQNYYHCRLMTSIQFRGR